MTKTMNQMWITEFHVTGSRLPEIISSLVTRPILGLDIFVQLSVISLQGYSSIYLINILVVTSVKIHKNFINIYQSINNDYKNL